MILKLIKALIGNLSVEDKKALRDFLEEIIKAAAAGAVQGAMKK